MGNRKRIVFFVCFLVCAVFLAGCREFGSEAGVETEGVSGGTVLEFYIWEDERVSLTAVAQAYMKENPQVTVNLNIIPTSEYGQGVAIALNGDKAVDIFCVSKPSVSAVYVKKGQAIALDNLIRKESADLSGFGNLLESLEKDGRTYMMPYRMSSWVVYYNKGLFDRIDMPYPQKGWTWDDYADMAVELTDLSGPVPIYGSLSFDLASIWWRTPARTRGDENPCDPDEFRGLMEAAQWSYDLTYEKKAQQPYTELVGSGAEGYNSRFLLGNVAMFYGGEWSLSELNEGIKKNGLDIVYDVAPMPRWEGETQYGIGTAATMMISAKSRNQEEAFKFMEFACGEQGAAILAGQSFLPAWKSPKIQKIFSDSMEMPEHSGYFFQDERISQIPPDTGYEEAMEITHRNVKMYLMRERNLEEVIQAIEQELTEAGLR